MASEDGFFCYTLPSPFTLSAAGENKHLSEPADKGLIVFGSQRGEYDNMNVQDEIKYARYVTSHQVYRSRVWEECF